MTSNEYCEALDALGLTQGVGTRLSGVDDRTSRRWAVKNILDRPIARKSQQGEH
jgi:hypothetical protein